MPARHYLTSPQGKGLSVVTASLPNGSISVPYSQTLVSAGGTGAQTWNLISHSGTNPVAVSSAGVVNFTPTTTETNTLVVQVIDSLLNTARRTLSLTVGSLPVAATPTFSPVAGTYTSNQSVTISCATPSSTIYYTTDGSTPTTGSAVYSAPITVSSTQTVKAIGTAASFASSAVGSAAYVINTGALSWKTLPVGSGGFVRGMNMVADGTLVGRTDTNGAYYYNGTKWVQMFTVNSMPSAYVTAHLLGWQYTGCFEIQIAPTNTSIFYAAYDGYVWVTANRGSTWTQTTFTRNNAGMNANDGFGQYGQRMAIDPNNANIVFVGTENEGLWHTTNGGTTWTQVATSSIPVGSGAGISGILFNAAGTVTGGVTQTIYAISYGNGVYVSNNAGATWTLTSGGPTIVNGSCIDSSGHYYAATSAGAYKYNGAWTTLFTDGNGVQTIAVNPFNINEVVALRGSGWINVSYDAGSTWSGANYQTTVVSTDIPWLAVANYAVGAPTNIFLDTGGSAFSPITNGQLICSAGTGAWKTTIPSSGFASGNPQSWTDFSVGFEQLVANEIVVPPIAGSNPVLASWDRAFFDITSVTSYPSTYGPIASDGIVAGWSVDYASSSPGFVCGYANGQSGTQSGYSTNNGASWTNFGVQYSSNQGGSISASSPTNIIISPANGVQPGYTTNGGTSWTGITLPGVTGWSGYGAFANYIVQRPVTADRVTANKFYLYYPGKGVYVSVNSGATWTQQLAGYIETNTSLSGAYSTLKAVPGNAGQLFYSSGNIFNQTFSNGQATPWYRSTNSGVSWSVVAGVQGVQCFDFGAIVGSYPSIWVVGYVSNVLGVYYSTDNAVTWTSIGSPYTTLQTLANISCIAADPNNFGRVYVGFGVGAGYAYYG